MADSPEVIRDLLRGRLSAEEVQRLQRGVKDPRRREAVLAIEQQRVPFEDRLLVTLQEHLFVCQTAAGERVVRCDCGHDFGDWRRNWKESALVYQQEGPGEAFVGPRAADPEWTVLREFYCPGCATQLDVEVVPVGYPFIHNFEPHLPEAPEP